MSLQKGVGSGGIARKAARVPGGVVVGRGRRGRRRRRRCCNGAACSPRDQVYLTQVYELSTIYLLDSTMPLFQVAWRDRRASHHQPQVRCSRPLIGPLLRSPSTSPRPAGWQSATATAMALSPTSTPAPFPPPPLPSAPPPCRSHVASTGRRRGHGEARPHGEGHGRPTAGARAATGVAADRRRRRHCHDLNRPHRRRRHRRYPRWRRTGVGGTPFPLPSRRRRAWKCGRQCRRVGS